MTSPEQRYAAGILGHERPAELRRLHLRERVMDPDTRRILAARGPRPSWRCLELGGGTGSIARWLGEQCPEGRVVVTDVDTRYLTGPMPANVEVLLHDVVSEDFPAGCFDLIHARSLLVNLPERDAVLRKIARWLAPGGWAVVEEPLLVHDSSPYPAFRRLLAAYDQALVRSHGADTRWARRLPAALRGAGLCHVGVSLAPQLVGDGGDGEAIWRAALGQSRAFMVEQGLIGDGELAAGLALLDEPSFLDVVMALVSGWGQKPGDSRRLGAP